MEIQKLPTKLADISLGKWVGWHDTYGTKLLLDGKRNGMTDDERTLFQTDFYCKHYAWYSNTPLEEVEDAVYSENTPIVELIKEASISQAELYRDMCSLNEIDVVNAVFIFEDTEFSIKPPVQVVDAKKLTVGEFSVCQDVALLFSDLQDGKYDALYELCLLYLHPLQVVDESDKLVKIEWIKSLPLHIALAVKKYVSDTINLYKELSNDRTTVTS